MLENLSSETYKDCEQAYDVMRRYSSKPLIIKKIKNIGFSETEAKSILEAFNTRKYKTIKQDCIAITHRVSRVTGVPMHRIMSKAHYKEIIHARHISFYFCSHFNVGSDISIAKEFGYSSASCIGYSCNYVNDLKFKDAEFKELINKLEKELNKDCLIK